ncbi:MAG: DUF4190 domain-containing protein [Acidimicrobiia bacterium]
MNETPGWGTPSEPSAPSWGVEPGAPSEPSAPTWGASSEPSAPSAPTWGAPSEPSAPSTPGWGAPTAAAPAPVPSKTNGLALAALLVGIFGFCIGAIGGVVAIILGFLGLKKPNGKGMAITRIILGFVNVILSVVAIVMLVAGVGVFSKAVSDATGIADTNTYEITIDDCRVRSSGSAEASGVITNTASSERSFTIVIEFVDKATQSSVEESRTVTSIAPGEDRDYSALTLNPPTTRGLSCRVKEVRNFFN